MVSFVDARRPVQVALITECSMSDNVAQAYPDLEFIRPCNLCPHMKRNTLGAIRHALETMTNEVTVPDNVADRARLAVERMLAVGVAK
jgi:quinolinate synthase